MLQHIRDNSQGLIAKVIIGLIVAVFALFGVESIIGGFVATPPVAEINGEEITEAQLQLGTRSVLNSVQGAAGMEQDQLEQIALNQLIEQLLLRQAANRGDMRISSDRLDRSIVENPDFQINGVFDPELAIRSMAVQGYNAAGYRQALSENLLIAQLANAFTRSAFVTEAELQTLAELLYQTRDFRYLSVRLGNRTLATPISEEAIAEYYETHTDQFTQQETVAVQYVMLDKDTIAAEIEVEEAELLAQYEAEREEFEGSAEKRAAHILFGIDSGQTAEQVVTAAAEVKQRLDAGEDFAALALEFSIDTVSAERGGDIGYTDGTAFPESVEAALEQLTPNAVSAPVVSEFGVHLVKLTEDRTRVFNSFEQEAARIEQELKSAEVDLIYAERLEDLSNLAFESADLQNISGQLGLELQQSAPFGRQGGTGLFADAALAAAAFSDAVLLEGNNSDVIELPSGEAIVLRIMQFNEASLLPLEEVKAEITIILRTEMEKQAVQVLGEQLLAAAEAGEGLDSLLAANDLAWLDAPATGRNATDMNREILDHVFSLGSTDEELPGYSSITLENDTFVLVELSGVNPGELDELEQSVKDNLISTLKSDLGGSDFSAYLRNLREDAAIDAPLLEQSTL